MTPEINKLEAEIDALEQKRDALIQAHLSKKAIAQVGEMIFWRSYKGRVLSFQNWSGDVVYRVRLIKKDGAEGLRRDVYPFDKPTAFKSA